jgi:hypothetical protein
VLLLLLLLLHRTGAKHCLAPKKGLAETVGTV